MAKTAKKANSLANKIGYNFADQNLFKRAVTHSSKSEENYERLEFLGDGILDFVVGEYLFVHTAEKEGKLTVLRSHYVSENNLCKIFDKLNLSDQVILGKSYQGEISKAIKGDIIEAIIASIYLDGGLFIAILSWKTLQMWLTTTINLGFKSLFKAVSNATCNTKPNRLKKVLFQPFIWMKMQ